MLWPFKMLTECATADPLPLKMQPTDKKISINEFQKGNFAAHGHIDFSVEGNVIVSVVSGPFNLEAIQALAKARRAVAEQWTYAGRRGAIAVFNNSILMSPEALTAYEDGLRSHFSKPSLTVALAWVVGTEVEGRELMLKHFERIFAGVSIEWKAFEDLESARTWIQEKVS